MFKNHKYNNDKFANLIRCIPFHFFGISANENFNMVDILNHIKTFNSCSDLENELNMLVNYIYEGKRKIIFHEFRQFPYIIHGEDNSTDASGLATKYTNSDVYLIKFIKYFIIYDDTYSFFDVEFIIKNTKRINFTECSILNMPIDEILIFYKV